jgi:hypothetical protein
MSDGRTKAERRVDELSAELRALRQKEQTLRVRNRIHEIERYKLPAAWRAVHSVRARP